MKKQFCFKSPFDVIVFLALLILTLLSLAPLLYIVSMSLSDEFAIVSHQVTIYPIGINCDMYRSVLSDLSILHAFIFSVVLTAMSMMISMSLTICVAYPLTKTRLKGRRIIFFFIMITMYFSGGIIPDFILVKSLKIMDTIWALLLPSAISTFNVIILRSFFADSIPQSIEDAAAIDGCNDLAILMRVVLPLSKPVLACLSLFYAVGRWNGFQDALFYITDSKLYTLQLKLYQLVYNNQAIDVSAMENLSSQIPTQGLKAATIVVATLPIMLMYPWLQKYFTSGITVGAVKG